MTRHTIQACPECDAAQVVRRSRAGGYRCERCCETFDEPIERESKQDQPHTAGGLSAVGKAAIEWEPHHDEEGSA